MSRGMPSMTALLGMLAIAGYQNWEKLADMFRNATSGQQGSGGKDSLSGLLNNLGGLVGSGGVGSLLSGGIGELLEQFKQELTTRMVVVLDHRTTRQRQTPRSSSLETPT